MLTFADVWQALNGQIVEVLRPLTIASVCIDSRKCERTSLFVALKGEQTDGHLYISDALSRGARYVIADQRFVESEGTRDKGTYIGVSSPWSLVPSPPKPPWILIVPDSLRALQDLASWWRTELPAQVIGVTGSVGKTVTKEMVASVISQRYRTLKSEGNLNSETGLPLTLLSLDGDCERVILEMAMYNIGEIARLAEISRPRIGVVTNVGPSHLERLGTMERIAQAKAELVRALPADGWAILNGDDPLVRDMQTQTAARVLSYGLDPANHVWASQVTGMGLQGTRFHLHYSDQPPLHVRIPVLGRHSVHTALAAATVGLAEGLSWEEIIRGLQSVPAQLRLVAVRGLNGSTLLDDTYNASPVSTIAALNLLHELEGRKIAVLADMLELGHFEREGHEVVGRRAAQVCDLLIVIGPRAQTIGESAIAEGLEPDRVRFCSEKNECVELLRTLLRLGDVVLIKGSRGMAMEEVVAEVASA